MPPDLELLTGVRWRGQEVTGRRPRALLAALVRYPGGLSDPRLVTEVWSDNLPTNAGKALQVLVSRIRAQYGPVVERQAGGYRLAVAEDEVDVLLVGRLAREASEHLADDPHAAAAAAERGLALLAQAVDADNATQELVLEARSCELVLMRSRGLALAALGRTQEAYRSLLEAHRADPDHAATTEALLRVEAVEVGVANALERYDRYRRDLSDRLGVDPSEPLQRLHRELLASDSPVHRGLRYDTPRLVGRARDLERLRAAGAEARLVTVLGPGGLGKTSVAQVLARESRAPRVHVVELVGVGPEDVLAEVGSAFGVRDSIATRRTLGIEQQADVRGRLAQEVDALPTLLVLDNCEHVLESVASLVAFLLATTRDLRVLTTSRAPLRLAAERVVPLSQLGESDAVRLFEERASAVRPTVRLDREVVREVVRRLEGLPLAIELAAAAVRTRSVEQVRSLLDDRLTLLRSRERSTPDRHRTLAAVVEWSWDLLAPEAQRALMWLSTFHDGFSEETGRHLLGQQVSDHLEMLVEHSLVHVEDDAGEARFRSLETIREFARLRLRDSGEAEAALRARARWALDLVQTHGSVLHAPDQPATVEALTREEHNLTDVLRGAIADADHELVVRILQSLATLWTVTGNQPRLQAFAAAAEQTMVEWTPPAELRAAAQEIAGVMLVHLAWLVGEPYPGLRAAVAEADDRSSPWVHAARAMHTALDDGDPPEVLSLLAADEPDDESRAALLMWAGLAAENAGSADLASDLTLQALKAGPRSPFLLASIHAELSALAMARADYPTAARHAEVAGPLLRELRDFEDAYALTLARVVMAIDAGEHDRATALLDEAERELERYDLRAGSRMLVPAARGEAAAAAGRVEEALATYDRAVQEVVDADVAAAGALPWLLFACAGALAVRARLIAPDQPARARELRDLTMPEGSLPHPDRLRNAELQVHGLQLVAVGLWAVTYGSDEVHEDGFRLLAIARTWTYNAHLPSMSWAHVTVIADQVGVGRADALLAEYAERPTRELVIEARELIARVTSFD